MAKKGRDALDWSIPKDVPEGRCGFTKRSSFGHKQASNVTCWRRPWEDYDRCIWHADLENKPAVELADARTSTWERLDGAVLRGTDLKDTVSFANCNLVCSDLTDAILSQADFFKANLQMADLTDTDLHGADLTDAAISKANLTDADLREADLIKCGLWGADLTKADIRGADLSDAYMPDTHLADASVVGAILTGANLQSADVAGADLQGADLTGADLYDADFTDADLRKAIISHNALADATLDGTNLPEFNNESISQSVDKSTSETAGDSLDTASDLATIVGTYLTYRIFRQETQSDQLESDKNPDEAVLTEDRRGPFTRGVLFLTDRAIAVASHVDAAMIRVNQNLEAGVRALRNGLARVLGAGNSDPEQPNASDENDDAEKNDLDPNSS